MLQGNTFTQIDDRKRVKQFSVSGNDKSLSEISARNSNMVLQTIASYQTASERFKNGKMKTR